MKINLSKENEKFLNLEQDEAGRCIISFKHFQHLPQTDPIQVQRLTKEENSEARKRYKRTYDMTEKGDGIPRHRLMSKLVQLNDIAHKNGETGPLDGKLTEQQIEEARRSIIPNGFGIHHTRSIVLSGSNKYDNLVLMENETHSAVHMCMDRVLAYVPYTYQAQSENTPSVFIRFPIFSSCVTNADGVFTPEQLQYLLQEYNKGKNTNQSQNKKPRGKLPPQRPQAER